MAVVTLLIVWMSEILVGTVEHASTALGLSNLFVGVVVVAVVGNAAEHSTAVLVAMRNRMETRRRHRHRQQHADRPVRGAAAGPAEPGDGAGAAQPRLLRREVFLVLMATFVASILIVDGKSTWFTGVQLLAVYLVMALTVFGVPAKP